MQDCRKPTTLASLRLLHQRLFFYRWPRRSLHNCLTRAILRAGKDTVCYAQSSKKPKCSNYYYGAKTDFDSFTLSPSYLYKSTTASIMACPSYRAVMSTNKSSRYMDAVMASWCASSSDAGNFAKYCDLIMANTGLINLVKIAGAKDQPKGSATHSNHCPFTLKLKYLRMAGCKRM